MSSPRTHRPVRRTLVFFLLTFVFSWSIWVPLAVTGSESGALSILGRFGPLLAALLLTGRLEGRAGLTRLWKTMLIWRVKPWWYAFALLSTAAVALAAIGVHVALGGETPEFNDPAQIYLIVPVFLYVLFLSVAGEETGWRGYALPRLQAQWGPLGASVVVGLAWGVWHVPLFWMTGDFHADIPFWLFLLQDVALSVVMTWLFNGTGGSLLLIHLFHAASNTSIGVLPVLPQDTGGTLRPLKIAIVLLWVVAGVITVSTRSWRRGPNDRSRARVRRPVTKPTSIPATSSCTTRRGDADGVPPRAETGDRPPHVR